MRMIGAFTGFVERFGEAVASVVLTVVYVAVLGPLALLVRAFQDPLRLRLAPGESAWRPWPKHRCASGRAALGRARRQS